MNRSIWESTSRLQNNYEQLSLFYDNATKMFSSLEEPGLKFSVNTSDFAQSLAEKLKGTKMLRTEFCLDIVITSLIKSEEYKSKTVQYKRLAKFIEREIADQRMMSKYFDIDFDWTSYENRLTLAQNLWNLARELYNNYSSETEAEFKQLESQFLPQLTAEEQYEFMFPDSFFQLADVVYRLMRGLRYEIVLIIRKLRGNLKRDVRTKLRQVIRYHFKNMDDEADVDQSFIALRNRLITSKSIHIWISNTFSSNSQPYIQHFQ